MTDGDSVAPMRRALLLDTETTGLDPREHRVIEVAACLYDLEIGCPIESYATLLQHAGGNEAEAINRIPSVALADAPHPSVGWTRVVALAERADVVAAHRAEFDRSFVEASILSPPKWRWVCTKTDFDWPGVGRGDSLVQLALAYGLGVASAHRALTDVDTMARVLSRVRELGHSLPDLFRRAARPKKRFVAMVSYEMRQVAKDAGFLWDGDRREWWRMMPPEDAAALTFRVAQRD